MATGGSPPGPEKEKKMSELKIRVYNIIKTAQPKPFYVQTLNADGSDGGSRLINEGLNDTFVLSNDQSLVIYQPNKEPVPNPFVTYYCAVRSKVTWALEPDLSKRKWVLNGLDYSRQENQETTDPEINITIGDNGPDTLTRKKEKK